MCVCVYGRAGWASCGSRPPNAVVAAAAGATTKREREKKTDENEEDATARQLEPSRADTLGTTGARRQLLHHHLAHHFIRRGERFASRTRRRCWHRVPNGDGLRDEARAGTENTVPDWPSLGRCSNQEACSSNRARSLGLGHLIDCFAVAPSFQKRPCRVLTQSHGPSQQMLLLLLPADRYPGAERHCSGERLSSPPVLS